MTADRVHVVATAGHVDHGKSTLLRRLTGMEPDRWEEERRRGLTIDLGFVWTDLGDDTGTDTVAFVDVPGHERFLPNMLAGVGAVRAALFVVAADDGWSAQSTEHLEILDLLGVSGAAVAVTKADLVDADRVEEVAATVTARLAGTSLEGTPLVVVDAVSGRGLEELGRVLLHRLRALPPAEDRGRPRLWIDRAFTITGAGTVVTGTLTGGGLAVGDRVRILPGEVTARIRALQSLGRPVEAAPPGVRVAINLAGLQVEQVGRGQAVVAADDPWRTTDVVDAWVRALPGRAVGRRGAWHLHVGSARSRVHVDPLLGDELDPGGAGPVRLQLEHPLPLVTGDRFVLREAGRWATHGGGEVLDPGPAGPLRGTDARVARAEQLEALAARPARDRLVVLVATAGGARPEAEVRAAADHDGPLPAGLRGIAGYAVEDTAAVRWQQAVLDAARDHHRHHPDDPGAGLGRLAAAAVAAGCPEGLAEGLVTAMAADGLLRRWGSGYVTAEDAADRDRVRADRHRRFLELLSREPFAPPPLVEAAREAGLTHEEVTALLHRGEVVRCGEFAFTAEAVAEAVRRLAALEQRVGPFTASQARQELGTTRRLVIPLLEHLDAAGVTVFDGQRRQLRRR